MTYRLAVGARVFAVTFGLVLVVGIVIVVVRLATAGSAVTFVVLWLAFVALVLFLQTRLYGPWVHAIDLHPDGRVVFRGLLGHREWHAREIVRVGADRLDIFRMYPIFETRDSVVRLFFKVERFHDLLSRLQRLNPSLRVDL